MQNILFRADSSSTIGTGHIMRDLVLAKQFTDANITFAVQDLKGNINHKVKEKNHKVEILTRNDIEEVDALIKKLNIDMIVIDHYGIDETYEKQLKSKNPALNIMSLDDTYEKHHCDILLNHNISADKNKYKGLVPNNCELRCGSRYTLLRDEFKIIDKRKRTVINKRIISVFIAMGGADHSNKNIAILNVLNSMDNIEAHVVTTNANQYLFELQKYAQNHKNITLHINTNQIAHLMNTSDIAIVTPSVTVNEVIFMDLPFIAIQTADNQSEIANYLTENRFIVLTHFESERLKNAIVLLLKTSSYADTLNNIQNVLKGEK